MMTGPNPSRWVSAIRRDRWVVTAFMAGMLAVFTTIGVVRCLVAAGVVWLDARTVILPFVAFSYLIGTVVHVQHIAPDIRWWSKEGWNKFRAQMEGTTVLRVPKGANFFLHWIMVHVPHHVDMRVPMYHLEEAAERHRDGLPGDGHRQAASARRLPVQHPGLQAVRLRSRAVDDLRRGPSEPRRLLSAPADAGAGPVAGTIDPGRLR